MDTSSYHSTSSLDSHFATPAMSYAPYAGSYFELLRMIQTGEEQMRRNRNCIHCHNEIPEIDEEAEYCCSRECAVADALYKLNGGMYDSPPVEEKSGTSTEVATSEEPEEVKEEEKEEREIPAEISRSSQLCQRLMELREVECDLTIDKLLETLQLDDDDDDSFFGSEETSRQSSMAGRNLETAHTGLALAESIGSQLEGPKRISETDRGRDNFSLGLDQRRFEAGFYAEPIPEIRHPDGHAVAAAAREIYSNSEPIGPNTLGMASKLRKVLNQLKRSSKSNGQGQRQQSFSAQGTSTEEPEVPVSSSTTSPPVAIPRPSGDEWEDFVNILRFTQKSGLGGPVKRQTWDYI